MWTGDKTEDITDDPFTPGGSDADLLQINVDVDGSGQFESGVDRLYASDSEAGQLVVTRDFEQNARVALSAGQAVAGFDASPNARTPHRIWELAIPLEELGVQPGQQLGMSLAIVSPEQRPFEEPLGSLNFTLAQPQ